MDNDSRMLSLGATLTQPNGAVISLAVKRVELNRDGGVNSISPVPLDLNNVELRYSREVGTGRISAGIGYDSVALPDEDSRAHVFVTWRQGF